MRAVRVGNAGFAGHGLRKSGIEFFPFKRAAANNLSDEGAIRKRGSFGRVQPGTQAAIAIRRGKKGFLLGIAQRSDVVQFANSHQPVDAISVIHCRKRRRRKFGLPQGDIGGDPRHSLIGIIECLQIGDSGEQEERQFDRTADGGRLFDEFGELFLDYEPVAGKTEGLKPECAMPTGIRRRLPDKAAPAKRPSERIA